MVDTDQWKEEFEALVEEVTRARAEFDQIKTDLAELRADVKALIAEGTPAGDDAR